MVGVVGKEVEGENEAHIWGWVGGSFRDGGKDGQEGVAGAVISQTPMEKQNNINNSRQITFAMKAKHLT